MADFLSRQLALLGDDSALRQANLVHLVSHLTHHEIRNLGAHLLTVDLRTDVFAKLPADLQLVVAQYFDIADFFHLVNVSKCWRALWLSHLAHRVERYLPGFFECMPNKNEPNGKPLGQERSLLDAARILHIRTLGKFRSAMLVDWLAGEERNDGDCFKLDPKHHTPEDEETFLNIKVAAGEFLTPLHPQIVLYACGRLAWQALDLDFPNNCLVFVDDFKSRLRKMYQVPNILVAGERSYLEVLGDKLVVARTSRTLIAWHLDSNTVEQVTLPYLLVHCITRGNRVVIVSILGDTAIWNYGQSLREVDTSSLASLFGSFQNEAETFLYSQQVVGAFFHPVRDDTFYTVSVWQRVLDSDEPDPPEILKDILLQNLAVHKFCGDSYVESFTLDKKAISGSCSQRLTRTQPRVINPYGDIEVARMRGFEAGLDCQCCIKSEDDDQAVGSVIFNTFQNTFSIRWTATRGSQISRPDQERLGEPFLPSRWSNRCTTACSENREQPVLTTSLGLNKALEGVRQAPGVPFKPVVYSTRLEVIDSAPSKQVYRRRRRELCEHMLKTWWSVNGDRPEEDLYRLSEEFESSCHDDVRFLLEWGELLKHRKGWELLENRSFEDDAYIVVALGHGYVVFSFWTDMVFEGHELDPSTEKMALDEK